MDSFLKNILESNRQLGLAGLQTANFNRLKKGGYDAVLIVGMGGSGLAGELLKDVAGEVGLRLPVFTWKDYGLPGPETIGAKKPLCIFVSFSGDTEETLSGLKAALKTQKSKAKTSSIAVLTHGGELAALARRARLPLVVFPAADLNPRQYTGRMFYGLSQILRAARVIPQELPLFNRLQPLRFKIQGRELARRLRGKIVLIYTDLAHRGLGYIWKAKLNETAKQMAFSNLVPEMNHNELASLIFPKTKIAALFISGASGPGAGRMRKRVRINLKLLKKKSVAAEEIPLSGRSRLEKIWNSTMLADWTSYFLAKSNQVSPSEIKIVEELKNLMKK